MFLGQQNLSIVSIPLEIDVDINELDSNTAVTLKRTNAFIEFYEQNECIASHYFEEIMSIPVSDTSLSESLRLFKLKCLKLLRDLK